MMLPIRYRVLTAHMVPINHRTMNSFLGFLRILNIIHVDKGKASGAAGSWIRDQLDFINATVLFKNTLQVTLVCLEAQTEYADDAAWTRI